MDQAITGLMIVFSFSLAHERVLELARSLMVRLPTTMLRLRRVVDWLTRGAGAVLPACALAVATRASLLDAFIPGAFFAKYLDWSAPGVGGVPGAPYGLARDLIGCLLMGLAVSFGSTFWHDLAKGLMDVRGRLQETRDAALPPPPAAPQRALLQEQG
jgi:hypothetical protein